MFVFKGDGAHGILLYVHPMYITCPAAGFNVVKSSPLFFAHRGCANERRGDYGLFENSFEGPFLNPRYYNELELFQRFVQSIEYSA